MEGPAPDRSFMRDLRLMDKRLGLFFNGEHFVVTFKRPFGEPVNVYRIKAEDGGFRQPDTRDLVVLKGGDLCGEDMKSRLLKLSAYSEAIRDKQKRDARDNIRHITAENKLQLAKAFIQNTNQGKANSAHRRIEQNRTGGRTWEEIKGANESA